MVEYKVYTYVSEHEPFFHLSKNICCWPQ